MKGKQIAQSIFLTTLTASFMSMALEVWDMFYMSIIISFITLIVLGIMDDLDDKDY